MMIRKLINHSFIYFISSILRYGISFIMLPIYTRLLAPHEYGIIEILTIIIDFTGAIFGLKIGESIFRFYLSFKQIQEKNEVISTSLILVIVFGILGYAVLFISADFLNKIIFDKIDQIDNILLYSLTLVFQPVIELGMNFLRAQQKAVFYAIVSAIKLFLQLALNLYFIVYLDLKITGVILSAVISCFILSCVIVWYCIKEAGIKFSLKKSVEIINFSYPLVFAGMISFYITFGDRYFLGLFDSLTNIGIYALAYKFGFLFTFIGTGPFFMVWDSEKYIILKEKNANIIIHNAFIYFSVFSLCGATILAIISKNIITIMANNEFWDAYKIVPLILIAYLFQGLMGFCNLGILVEKKTIIITKSNFYTAIIITVLYLLLIPKFSYYGAALSTAIAFAFRFFFIFFKSRALLKMQLQWKIYFYLVPINVFYFIIFLLGPNDKFVSVIFNSAIICLLIISLSYLPIFTKKDRMIIKNYLLRPWKIILAKDN